ncbi:MAG: hypothetical protein DMF50_13485 [Acidobacteria bacterium]|nr:MAG: hypothetical protein DMF50_13485 [Acidobacteriota bacterium]
MSAPRSLVRVLIGAVAAAALLAGPPSLAQVTPAAGYTPPDDTPTIKVGATIFTEYSYQDEPLASAVDGTTTKTYHPAAFNVTRAYINITGNISHNVSFRVTPDVSRLTTTTTGLAAGEKVSTSLDGSLTYRLKYAYGQFNLDDKWTKGSWVRLGVHHTPYVDWEEGIYRYRFQGQIFVEREGFMSSSDFGLSAHYSAPGNFGDVHVGYYNGDTYSKAEANDQKAIQIRGTLRPMPQAGVLKGLRLTAFYDADNYIQGDARRRFIYTATFEHKYVNAGFEHLDAADRSGPVVPAAAEVKSQGYSVWVVPRSPKGWEGLLRFDHLKPNKNVDAAKDRKIAGVAYWFHSLQAPATAALLLDYENVTYDTALAKPDEKRYGLHALFNF